MQRIPILNIQQFEQQQPVTDFYSNELAYHLNKNKDFFHKPHSHDFYLCVLFSEGTGLHEIDFNTYEVKPGSVFFLKPGQTHYWKFDSQPKGYIFFHTQDFYDLQFFNKSLEQFPFYFSHKNQPNLTLTIKEVQQLEPIFSSVNGEYHQELPFKRQKIASLINTIYIDLARYYVAAEPVKTNSSLRYIEILRALEKEINKHYKTEKLAKFYANQLNITPKHLNRIVKTTLGKTTTDLITERVLLESKRLMVHSDNSLAAIAENLGYDDYAYFSKVFKLKTNMTPMKFKKSYQ